MANQRRDKNFRESWTIKNKTKHQLAIGDLPLVDTFGPGEKRDLLKFYSRESISHSIDLVSLIDAKWVTLEKKRKNKTTKTITSKSIIEEGITPAEEDEITDALNAAIKDADEAEFDITTVTSDYTTVNEDDVILANATSANITITLPSALLAKGLIFYIKKIDSSANTVTVDGKDSETIDDATTAVLSNQYESITIISDGTEWWIL